MEKKYKIRDDGRIVALRDFGLVKKGDVGGFIENEENLSHDGTCWIFNDAYVSGNAYVFENALVSGNALVAGNAKVNGNSHVSGNLIVTKTPPSVLRSDGYDFIIAPDSQGEPIITAGCRYFTIEEAKEHWERTRGNTPLGKETMRIIKYLEDSYYDR